MIVSELHYKKIGHIVRGGAHESVVSARGLCARLVKLQSKID
jgi:hypothetical protein